MLSLGPDYKQAAKEFLTILSNQDFLLGLDPSVDQGNLQSLAQPMDEFRKKNQPENTPQLSSSFSAIFNKPEFQKMLMQTALEKNDAAMIERLLNNKILPDYEALTTAAKEGRWEGVSAFVKHNPESDTIDCKAAYEEVLLYGAKNKQEELVNNLLDKKVLVNRHFFASAGEHTGWSALHFAIANNQKEWVTKMVEQCNAYLNQEYAPPLQVAFSKDNNTDMINLLISKGAKVNYAAFKADVKANKWDRVRAFVKNNPEGVSKKECADAYAHALQVAFSKDNTDMINLLTSKGAKVDYAVFKADAEANKWERVRAFIKNNPEGVSVEACADAYGKVLLSATRAEQKDVVNSLLDKNADLTWHSAKKDEYENYGVIHFAVAQGNMDLVKKVLDKSYANPDQKLNNGPTPWQVAFKQQNNVPMIKLLVSGGAKPDYTVLKGYVDNSDHQLVNQFLQLTPYNPAHPECVALYNELYYQAIKKQPDEPAPLDDPSIRIPIFNMAGLQKDPEVATFLADRKFEALEKYLVKTQEHDALPDDSSWGWKQMKKHDVLNAFVGKLKACGTMEEVRRAFEGLQAPNEKNLDNISDYALLNTARGWGYRFFGLNTTTIGRIDDLKALIPPVASEKKLK